MHKNRQPLLAASLTAALLLGGCAAPSQPRPIGAVVPMEGGRFRSTLQGPDEAQVMKTFVHDAQATCFKGDGAARMPWEGKPAPAKYVVVSQAAKTKEGKPIQSSDNKLLDAGIAVGLRHAGLENKDAVEVVTVFQCQ